MDLKKENSIKVFEAIENLYTKITPQENIIVKSSSEKLANIIIIENIIKSGLYDCDIINKQGRNILGDLIIAGRSIYVEDYKLAKQYIIPLAILLAKNKNFSCKICIGSPLSLIQHVIDTMLQYNFDTKDDFSPMPINISLNDDVSLDNGITQNTKLLMELIDFPNINLVFVHGEKNILILSMVIDKRNETLAQYILTNGIYKSRLQLLLVYNSLINNNEQIITNLEKFITNEDWIKELCLYIPHLSNTGVTKETLPTLKRQAFNEQMHSIINTLKSYESILI